jgi:hypothetical protein
VVKQFYRVEIWSGTECKTPAEYGIQHNSTPPRPTPSHSHILSVYNVHLVWERGRGREIREKIEGQQYMSIVPSFMGATVHKLGQKYQHHEWMYLQSIKSVKHNASKYVNRSILKKAGVFVGHLSMLWSNVFLSFNQVFFTLLVLSLITSFIAFVYEQNPGSLFLPKISLF